MEKLEQAQFNEEEEFTTFEDVFVLALANTSSNRFKADSNEWHRVFYEVCDKYREQIPQLEVIFFRERPPLPPQTRGFYQLINTLSMSGLISLPNPDYDFIVMDEDQKSRALNLETKRLEKYKDQIKKISEILDKRLAVKG